MKIKFFKATWGMTEGRNLDEKFELIAKEGYEGVEAHLEDVEPQEMKDLCEKHQLEFVCQIYPLTVDDLKRAAEKAAKAGSVSVNSHSGRDKWSDDEGRKFWEGALAAEKEIGITINHETHRYRMLFNPWDAARYLRAFPDLRVTLDLSHWCCVCESLLEDLQDEVNLAISRARHIHARVGHREGPQVPDPSAPEWKLFLDTHVAWWDAVKAEHEKRGEAELIVTPEFGPPQYQWTLPHTNQQVSDLWVVNKWMKDFLSDRWS